MRIFQPLALATLLAATAPALLLAQANPTPTPFSDPANLAGERLTPRNGRELPIDTGTLGLQQLLRKLQTRASILNIVAHPDDEDGGMLTLYARGLGARVADLSLTRGEGGQNAMTGDFEDALGLLRTQELLSNDRYTGVTQMFGTEVDFGFSKTKQEAFSKWTHDRVLYDAVRAIRLYRPLVITATFIGNPTDGHGQHQVSGEIAQEAFLAAGDPAIFPELTREGILPWQPLKVYARVPMAAISEKGLYDYATGQHVPVEFTNYVTGEKSTTPPTTDVIVHEGAADPLLTGAASLNDAPHSTDDAPRAYTYIQLARIGLGLQKSQIGPGVRTAPRGAFDVDYHLYGSCLDASKSAALCHLNGFTSLPSQPEHTATQPPASPASAIPQELTAESNFFTGIDTSLTSIAPVGCLHDPFTAIQAKIDQAVAQYQPDQPTQIAPLLADALSMTDRLLTGNTGHGDPIDCDARFTAIDHENIAHELRIKRVQLNDALALSLGVSLTATVHENRVTDQPILHDHDLTPAESALIVTTLTHPPDPNLKETSHTVLFNGKPLCAPCTSADSAPSTHTDLITLPRDAEITRPYFSRTSIEQPVDNLRVTALRNAAQTPHPLVAEATLTYNHATFTVASLIDGNSTDDAQATQAADIVPASNTWFATRAQVVPLSESAFDLTLYARGDAQPSHGLDILAGSKPLDQTGRFSSGSGTQYVFRGAIPPHSTSAFEINALTSTTHTPAEGFRPVGYADLPRTNYFTPATVRIVPVDLKLPPPNKRRIAYLPGTGDPVPEALTSISLQPTILTVADLTPTRLSAYDTVILGVRTYNAHPDLHGAPTQALLDFARAGGNVVVQYQTQEFTAEDAPYPLALGTNEKVVDETAPVALNPRPSALLTTPNAITPADFNNWIEERGHGFLSTWDDHYTALTETHDPGAPAEHVSPQLPQRGGLLTTPLGKGRWTYVAFALYRQLPEAVPGAYRLFVNLITP